MAINEDDVIRRPQHERRKLSGVDHPVLQVDNTHPNGRTYGSVTYTTPIPDRPHILPSAASRRLGFETLISVNVEPTELPLPEMAVISPYEESYQYFNRTTRKIKVTNKHNVTFTLPQIEVMSINYTECLVVRKSIRFGTPDLAKSVLYNHAIDGGYLSVDDGERATILFKINEAMETGNLKHHASRVDVVIDRLIPIKLFNDYGGIYVSDLDMLFRLEPTDLGTPHPTSQDAIIRGEILSSVVERRVTGALYEIVDNEHHYTPRYVCLGKDVHQIPSIKDPGRISGIYHTKFSNVNMDHLQISVNRCGLDKGEELGIYQTREDAATKGHINDAFKLEIAQIQRAMQAKEAEILQLKFERQEAIDKLQHHRKIEESQLDIDKTVLSHAKDRLATQATTHEILLKMDARLEQDAIERRQLQRKALYEERSLDRKDTSEVLKWAPAMITTIAGITTAVLLHQNKESNKRQISGKKFGFDFDI